MGIDEGALKLLDHARELSGGETKRAAYMLLTAAICMPNRDKFLKAVNGMFDQIEKLDK
jgi:L-lysine 2,3-aminomutase